MTTTDLHRLSPPTEAVFQSMVLQLAKLRGWRCAHFRPSLNRRGKWSTAVAGDGAGWPDLVLVRTGRVIYAELKAENGRLSEEQKRWRDALVGALQEWHCWRPSSWSEIEKTLE